MLLVNLQLLIIVLLIVNSFISGSYDMELSRTISTKFVFKETKFFKYKSTITKKENEEKERQPP